MANNGREALEQFLGAYFHQDWPDEYGSWEEAVDAFKEDTADEDAVESVAAALEKLAGSVDDTGLAVLLENLGSSYEPSGDDLTHRAWVKHVVTRLRADA